MLPGWETQVRLFKAGVVGGTAFIVQIGLFWVFVHFLAAPRAHTSAFICSVITHYSLNRFWALPSGRTDKGRQLLEYLGTAVIGWGIQHPIFLFCLRVVKMNPEWSNVFAVPPSTIAVILILNFHVFRKHA